MKTFDYIPETAEELVSLKDYHALSVYDTFLEGFVMFLSWRRVNGDTGEYKFKTYLDELKKDSKFFKKLQGMSWADSTRKNVYKWFMNTNKRGIKITKK